MQTQPNRPTASHETGLRLAQLVIDEAVRNPWLASLLLQRKPDWVTRLAAAARRLWSLPRQLRRDLWRKLASGLTAAALLLALNPPMPVMAATISVAPGASGIGMGDGCSLVEAIYAAEYDSPVADCTTGSGVDTITLPANSTFSYTATYDGTSELSIFQISTDITIEGNGSTIERNSGASGNFRIFFVESTGSLTLNHVTLTGGNANDGGAIRADGYLTINDSTITGNSSNRGGGIFMSTFPTRNLTITNSTISNNTAGDLGGGGMYIDNVDFVLENSTISGNTANGFGAGFSIWNSYSNIINSTITGNSTPNNDGGGFFHFGGDSTMYLSRSIVSGNSAFSANEIFLYTGDIVANDFNLFGHYGEDNSQAFTGFTPGASDIVATNDTGSTPALLSEILNTTLADNGGLTETHALVALSPAIDQITPSGGDPFCMDDGTSTDQRGGVRADGVGRGGAACDIGAYEYGSAETPTALTLASFSAATPLGWVATAGAAVLATIGAGWLALRRRFGG